MPYKNKPRPYKKEYRQQKARGEHANRMERQRARRKIDKRVLIRTRMARLTREKARTFPTKRHSAREALTKTAF